MKLTVAFLTTDSREHYRKHAEPRPFFGTAPAALLQGFEAIPDLIDVQVVSCLQKPVSPFVRLAPNICYHGLHVPPIGWLKTGYQGCIRAVRRWVREHRPDLVHGQGTERDCALSAVLSGAPNLITIHGNMRRLARVGRARPFSFDWLAARLEGWTVPRAGGVLCITRHAEQEVRGLARRTWIVPNAVDPGFLDGTPAPVRPKRVLCVANLAPVKNQNGLIRALDRLAGEVAFELVFHGQWDPAQPHGREFGELLASRPWCRYAGFLDRAALKEALRAATLLVLPSLEENCPMSILEAMAAGVPVAASRSGGIPDLVEDEVTGLLFDPAQPGTMDAAVRRLLADEALAGRLAAQARLRLRERFLPEVVARRHVDVYRELLSTCS